MKSVAISAVVLGCLLVSCSHGGGVNCDTCHGEQTSPIFNEFGATPTVLPAGGGNVTLTWTVYGATSLSLSNGLATVTPIPAIGTSGSIVQNVTVTSTLTLSATNVHGTSTVSVLITVQ